MRGEKDTVIKRLEEAYRLVQSTAITHGDKVASSRLLLMGAVGDKYDWEDLEGLRTNLINRWYDLNKKLGDHYFTLTNQLQLAGASFGFSLERACEHYSQCHLAKPTYGEAVLALMQLAHSQNDLSTLYSVYSDYKASCKKDGWKEAPELVAKFEEYRVALGDRFSRQSMQVATATTLGVEKQEKRRKVGVH